MCVCVCVCVGGGGGGGGGGTHPCCHNVYITHRLSLHKKRIERLFWINVVTSSFAHLGWCSSSELSPPSWCLY